MALGLAGLSAGFLGSAEQQQSGMGYQSLIEQMMRQNQALTMPRYFGIDPAANPLRPRKPKPSTFRAELQAEVDEWLPKL